MSADADMVREHIDRLLHWINEIVEYLERNPQSIIVPITYNFLVPELQNMCGMLAVRGSTVVEQGDYIDPDDERIEKLKRAYEAIGVSPQNIVPMTAFARVCKELRAAIILHDLATEPRPQELFDCSAKLIVALHGA